MATELSTAVVASREIKRVLLDFGSVDFLDITGGDELLRLVRNLRQRGVSVAFVRVRDPVREDMRRAGIEAEVAPINFYERITDGVRAWQKQCLVAPNHIAGATS